MNRFLFISKESDATALAWKLYAIEGHEVMLYIEDPKCREHLQGIVPRVESIKNGLSWVGRTGYIIAEDERDMSEFRKAGYKCWGGNALTKKMENDREFELTLCQSLGFSVPKFHKISSIQEGIKFIKSHPRKWAAKQMGHLPKAWNYIGHEEDGADVILQLEWIQSRPEYPKMKDQIKFMLQEVVENPLEFAVAAWWIGDDWKRDDNGNVLLFLSREHKKAREDDRGQTCGESGTVGIFTTNAKLFEETLDLLTPWLLENCRDVRMVLDANCGINDEDGEPRAHLYEITGRMGYPAHILQEHLLSVPAGEFYADIIDARQGNVETKPLWGVVNVLGCGNYPHDPLLPQHEGSFRDQPVEIELSENLLPLNLRQDEGEDFYRVADWYEEIAAAVDSDEDIMTAQDRNVDRLKSVVVRAPQFRSDIGKKFVEKEFSTLKEWGYV
jgi:phosphoribosylamine-glycine ligase